MRIKQGDTVSIITGDDQGRTGKVLKVFPDKETILIEGINIQKKHRRAKKEGEKGQIVEKPGPVSISNVKLVCPKCGKVTRVGYQVKSEIQNPKSKVKKARLKVRICKKCKTVI